MHTTFQTTPAFADNQATVPTLRPADILAIESALESLLDACPDALGAADLAALARVKRLALAIRLGRERDTMFELLDRSPVGASAEDAVLCRFVARDALREVNGKLLPEVCWMLAPSQAGTTLHALREQAASGNRSLPRRGAGADGSFFRRLTALLRHRS